MAFTTPSVNARTFVETAAAPADPVATRLATLIVEDATEAGTPADATFCDNAAANAPAGTPKPCRASRFASSVRAVLSRLDRAPSGMLSRRAAS